MKRNQFRPGTQVITCSGTHATIVRKRYDACLIEYAQGDVTCGEWHRLDTLKIDNQHPRSLHMDQHAICSACGQHWTTTDVETATAGELGTLVLGALNHLQHSSPPQHKATVMPDTAQHALSIDTDSPGNVK